MEPAAEPPLMNPTLCTPELSEHTQQEVWLLKFSGELGGTGRNLGGTWRAKQLSFNTYRIESFHLSRGWIWHIPWWNILQCKYCPWEVCCSAEVNIKLALGCIRFTDVAVRAEMQAWWFLRAQEGTGDGLGHMFHPSGRCVICASARWDRTDSTLQGLRLPVGTLSGTWSQSSLFLSVKFQWVYKTCSTLNLP